jgi:hypothetical protein
MSKMYRELSVWKRIDDKRAVRFRCFEEIGSHVFCIQSADFYSTPLKSDVVDNFDRQLVELLLEIEPAERSNWFASIEEAIVAHEDEFRSMAETVAALEKKQ